ncbi:uncharacterized protein LOC106770434 [Vigna radiata var. radiata]|uniref:Uncharacterized protein LOC106770434 n=1 Tax=Vigna radiata var. radiata TaxID=3916 RepID=A0A1S3V073_VIGRR|nr:uncharacterized protein LOC106770434 [Vigna radiata var. radiata]
MGDLCSCWDATHNVIVLQHNKIRASFEKSINLKSDAYKALRYKRLVGRVSRYALELIADEVERVNKIGLDSARCGCILTSTYGLPCACILARSEPGMIPIGEIHVIWTRLSISRTVSTESLPEFSLDREVKLVQERFKNVDIGEKVNIRHKMLEIACPEMTSMLAPAHKVKTKGARKTKVARHERSTKRDPSYFEHVDTSISRTEPSSSRKSQVKSKPKGFARSVVPFLNQFHLICQPYIVNVVDVVADGHCGYRCIAALLGLGEEAWPTIRHNLYEELTQWRDEFANLVGSYDRLEKLRQSLIVHDRSQVNAKKWMTIPDIGYAIANRYNVILACLSYVQSFTIFPLRTPPPTDITQHRILCIGFVNGCHFVQVQLQDGCPLPMVDIISSNHCYPEARSWSTCYTHRMQSFMALMGANQSYVDLGED